MAHYNRRDLPIELPQDTDGLSEHIGKKLRQFREKHHWTLEDLAQQLDLSHTQISKYEQGRTKISAPLLYQIARLFSVSIDSFYDGYQEQNDPSHHKKNTSNTVCTTPKERLSVLLIEDSPSDAILLRTILSEGPFDIQFHCIDDGNKVMPFLRHHRILSNFPKPNLIFLDLNLPSMDGVKILRAIKQDRDLQDIPVIVLTGNLDRRDMEMAYKNYASGYMVKSLDYNRFRQAIQHTLSYWGGAVVLPT